MQKRRNPQEWLSLIQECRASGYSDLEWCRQNNISLSSFYYNLRALRKSACEISESIKPTRQELQEVVQVSVSEESPCVKSLGEDNVAVRLGLNGITVEIINGAAKSTIENTLFALQSLC